ncbi:MAG: auxin-responsive promoter [Dehalococcoidia bacterium]|nr:auxin-responsive promoter [Dehalococcoidia bacterium]
MSRTSPSEVPAAPAPGVGALGTRDPKLVWKKYCGFLDLSLRDFMDIQSELLMEQIDLVHASPLGRHLLRGTAPKSVSEFRSNVPLTTYGGYVPFLSLGNDGILGEKPAVWAHTTGAQAGFKWVPYSRRGLERLLDNLMAAFILAAASRREDVRVWPGDTVLYNAPERPYLSGLATFGMAERFGFRGVLDAEVSESLDFKERVRQGFRAALGKRVDLIVSMTSVLVKVGEEFAEKSRQSRLDPSHLGPLALSRLGKAFVKRHLLRGEVLPRDLWPAKAIVGWGVDTPFFRDKVRHYWGKLPFEMYACTEGGLMGMQTQEKEGLVFNPYADFFEFIPMDESLRSREDDRYRPRTVLLDEVEPGKSYEVVITNFYGMAFIRYRVGHFVQFLPTKGDGTSSRLPQAAFLGRADDRIDLAGFTRLDEKTVWEALNLTDLKYEDWTVRKEFEADTPILHMYTELRGDHQQRELEELLHEKLKKVDPFYSDLEALLGIRPLRVTRLPSGTFDRFYDERRKGGYELGRLKPPRINASDDDIADLMKVAGRAQ